MPTSQNGYSANDRTKIHSVSVPGGSLAVRIGPTGDLLQWVAHNFHTFIEPLVWPGCWGYAERTIIGDPTQLSNHASGTAIDLNAPAHPLGTNPSSNYTREQIADIHTILAACDGCVRWGGDYTGRKDGMHFEIVSTVGHCASVLTQLTPIHDTTGDNDVQLTDLVKLTSWEGTPPHNGDVLTVNDIFARLEARTTNLENALLAPVPSLVDNNVLQNTPDALRHVDLNVVALNGRMNNLDSKLDWITNTLQKMLEGGKTV